MQPRSHRLQQVVAELVAEAVVDEFEAIEIDERDGQAGAIGRRSEQCLLQTVLQQRPVRKSGERVIIRLVLDARLIPAALRHILDGPFITDRRAVFGEQRAGVFRNPDDVAVLAIDLGLEARYRAARLDDPHEFIAPLRIDVQLSADVVQRFDQFLRRVETVDVGEGWIRVEVFAVGRGAENALDRVVEQAVIAPLCLAQRLFGVLALRDVLDEPFQGYGSARAAGYRSAALPNPADRTVRVLDAVLEVERPARVHGADDGFPYPEAVVIANDVFEAHAAIQQQIGRLAAGDGMAAGADELHCPVRVQAAAVNHAVYAGQQSVQHPCIVLGRFRGRDDGLRLEGSGWIHFESTARARTLTICAGFAAGVSSQNSA